MLLCIIAFLLALVVAKGLQRKRLLPLPPGPKGSFFLGVVRHLRRVEPWKQYAEWGRQYGGSLLSFRVYNKQIIILNNGVAVRDLLDRRAGIYSDRPKSWMFHELCGRGKAVFNISSTDDRHRQYRKILAKGLGATAMQGYWGILESEVRILLQGFKISPTQFDRQIRRYASAVIMKVAYGYTVSDEKDDFISVTEDSARISGMALAQGWVVDSYPIVRFIPTWFPFAGFKRQAIEWRKRLDSVSNVTHNWVKAQMAGGSYTESFTSRLMRPEGREFASAEEEDLIKWCAGGLYVGATDTIISAIISFVMLMALHPGIQTTAQEEIDRVVGREPTASDVIKLPYLSAVFKEVLRYAPVANLALPHKVIQEDEYDGYRIPKGATIIPNVWAIMHDPDLYPEPNNFDPTRFLSKGTSKSTTNPDPKTFSFGFGRRTCPGILFTETSVLLTMASILSEFEIRVSKDAGINQPEFTTGITSHVKPFSVDFLPR